MFECTRLPYYERVTLFGQEFTAGTFLEALLLYKLLVHLFTVEVIFSHQCQDWSVTWYAHLVKDSDVITIITCVCIFTFHCWSF